jgi:hypothetical protein
MDRTQSIAGRSRRTTEKEERRAAERHPFCEAAEVTAVGQGNRLVGRVADISMEGCYVDTFNPFPVETLVRIKITKNGAEFVCTGAVRNSQSGMGMGITFAEISGASRLLLEQWNGKTSDAAPAAAEALIAPEVRAPASASPASPASSENAASSEPLARKLIELLREKGQLTEGDLATLFPDPDDLF